LATHFILLDRDGVLNEDSDAYIKSPDEWQPIPGSMEALALLNQAGYHVVVITNQSGLARGLFTNKTLNQIHAKMHRMAGEQGGYIEKIYYCPHGPDDGCNCRKPAVGLLLQFAREYGLGLTDVPFVGDSIRDIEAALNAGASPILVRTGKGQKTLQQHPNLNIPIFDNLYDAAKNIISRQ